mmetsp:Transcript_50559/g.161742  ORF Transcript_50559/g.161742 Transcript_50559/m.161742 type:complete len:128 (-) Transcript_50559:533-916(-)
MYMWLFTAVGFAGACYFVVNYFFKVLDKETDRLMKLDQQRINRPRNGKFTREEVAKHGSRDDLWVIIHDKVYDITDYVDEHPGGDAILSNAGGDSTEKFFGPQHPQRVFDMIDDFEIGELVETSKDK